MSMYWWRPIVPTMHITILHTSGSKRQGGIAQGSETFTLLPMIATAFLRLVTNPRVFSEPDSIEDAIVFIDVLLDTPGVVPEDCGKEWPLLRDKLLTHKWEPRH